MPTTISIPLSTLAPNQIVSVPSTSIVGFSGFQLLVNRNVGISSLDSLTTAESITMQVDESPDGVTWFFLESGVVHGGVEQFTDKGGVLHTVEQDEFASTFSLSSQFVRASVTNGSTQVSVSGSLTLS